MSNHITLTGAMRSNLLALQDVQSLMNVTQQRLATGRKVNSAVDDATAYFSAQQGFTKADDLDSLKSSMNEGLQKVKTALTATDSAVDVLKEMKALSNQALATSDADSKADLMAQFNELASQLSDITQTDANYKGTNLLSGQAGNDLVIDFNEDGTSQITIAATDTSSATYIPADAADWATDNDAITASRDAVTSAIKSFESLSSRLGSYDSFIQTRIDFTTQLSNIFETGAEDLVSADTNEESANLLTLQTQQSLSTSALSISSQAAQSVLKLF